VAAAAGQAAVARLPHRLAVQQPYPPPSAADADRLAGTRGIAGSVTSDAGAVGVLRDDRQGRQHRFLDDEGSVRPRCREESRQRGLVVPRAAPMARTSARRAAVLGSPIAHSLSPALHRAAYADLELDWSYDAIECVEAGLTGFVASLVASWSGLSVTMLVLYCEL